MTDWVAGRAGEVTLQPPDLCFWLKMLPLEWAQHRPHQENRVELTCRESGRNTLWSVGSSTGAAERHTRLTSWEPPGSVWQGVRDTGCSAWSPEGLSAPSTCFSFTSEFIYHKYWPPCVNQSKRWTLASRKITPGDSIGQRKVILRLTRPRGSGGADWVTEAGTYTTTRLSASALGRKDPNKYCNL